MKERIQKILSSRGLTSRRAAEKLLEEGRITVNGLIAQLGDRADADIDQILVDGAQVLLKLQLLSSQIMAGTLPDRAGALILPFSKTFIIILVF